MVLIKPQAFRQSAIRKWRAVAWILCLGCVGLGISLTTMGDSPLSSNSFLLESKSPNSPTKETDVPPQNRSAKKEEASKERNSPPPQRSSDTKVELPLRTAKEKRAQLNVSLGAAKRSAPASLRQQNRQSTLQCEYYERNDGTAFETHRPLQCSDLENQNILPVSFCNATNKCIPGHSFPQLVHARKDIVSDTIQKGGCWEKPIVRSIVEHFGTTPRPDQYRVFIDVGGNVGAYTTVMANLGHPVISIEPFRLNVPLILGTLCQLRNNNIGESSPVESNQVHLFKVALSDTSPGQKMCLKSTNNDINIGNGHLVPLASVPSCMETVQSYTLDELVLPKEEQNGISTNTTTSSLLRPGHRVWGMKMDIEGFETRALQGASGLLAAPWTPCRIWFEYHRGATVGSGVGPTDIFQLLWQAGYTEMHQNTAKGWQQTEISMNRANYPQVADFMVVHKDAECRDAGDALSTPAG